MLLRYINIGLPFIWFGMVLAISFIEAPLKFKAPGITLPLGLGIGRLVFGALNMAELLFGLILLFTYFVFARGKLFTSLTLVLIYLILVVQTIWLLPVLDLHAVKVIEGTAVPGSYEHMIYIFVEVIKLLALLIFGSSIINRQVVSQ